MEPLLWSSPWLSIPEADTKLFGPAMFPWAWERQSTLAYSSIIHLF